MSNENFIAPQGSIGGTFVPPSSSNSKEKNPNVQLLYPGVNLGYIYALIDLGTQTINIPGSPPEEKRMLFVGVEYPQLKQLFYVGDTEPRSTVCSKDLPLLYMGASNSGIRKFTEAVIGSSLSDDQARSFNLFSLLGAKVGTDIIHQRSKRTNEPYMKISGFTFANENYQIPPDFVPTLNRQAFFIDCDPSGNVIGNNFKTENFANLYPFLKKKILESKEAKEYIAKGGQFAEKPREESGSSGSQSTPTFQNTVQNQPAAQSTPQQTPSPVQNAPVVDRAAADGIKMLVNDYTYEQYLQSGWTKEQLIQTNRAQAILTAPPVPQAPQASQAPQAPTPQAPPSAPGIPQPIQNQGFGVDDPDDLPF